MRDGVSRLGYDVPIRPAAALQHVKPVIGVYGTTGRIEKGYRAFGFELDGEYDVVEADMAWGKVKDEDFVGKEAHVRQRAGDPAAIMCTLTVDDHTSSSGMPRYMLGHEPIVTRHGAPLTDAKGRRSFVTTAGSGPSVLGTTDSEEGEMARLINHTSMTVDVLCDVGDWYLAEGDHDPAGVAILAGSAGFVTGRKCYEGFLS